MASSEPLRCPLHPSGQQEQGEQARGVSRGFGVSEGVSERVSERSPGTSERTPCIGEPVTECTSQKSPSTLSETLSECQFLPESWALLPLMVLPLKTPTKTSPESATEIAMIQIAAILDR